LYISAYGGGSFFDSADFTGTDYAFGPSSTGHIKDNGFQRFYPEERIGKTNGTFNLDNGWIVGGAVGIRTQRQWRFELDINHTQSPFDDGTLVEAELTSMILTTSL